jgi:putative copper export protein
MRITDPKITSTVALVAAAVWLGGLLALGAIVAPIVFTMIPRPEAADAMTAVFARFDVVAVVCVVIILVTEAWRVPGQARISRKDVARMLAGAIGAVLVLGEALWITPAIVALHRGGAVRGLGSAGLELDRMHGLAEACGKVQVVVAIALIVLEVATLGPRAGEANERMVTAKEAPHGA